MATSSTRQSPPPEILNQQFLDALDKPGPAREAGIAWLRNSIAIFERKYGMSSEEMRQKVHAAKIEETDDISSWLIKADLLLDVQ